jgi:CAAX protease family protein
MVWVYDRTGSLLVAMFMHGSLTATQLIFMPPPSSGMTLMISILAWAAALWIVVAIIAVGSRWQIAGPPPRHQMSTAQDVGRMMK